MSSCSRCVTFGLSLSGVVLLGTGCSVRELERERLREISRIFDDRAVENVAAEPGADRGVLHTIVSGPRKVVTFPFRPTSRLFDRDLYARRTSRSGLGFLRGRPAFFRTSVRELLEKVKTVDGVTREEVLRLLGGGEGAAEFAYGESSGKEDGSIHTQLESLARDLASAEGYQELSLKSPSCASVSAREVDLFLESRDGKTDSFFFFFGDPPLLEAVLIIPVDEMADLFRQETFCRSFLRVLRGEPERDAQTVLTNMRNLKVEAETITRYDCDPIDPGFSLKAFRDYCTFLEKARLGGRSLPVFVPEDLPRRLRARAREIQHGYAEVRTFSRGESSFALYFLRKMDGPYTFEGFDYLPKPQGVYPLSRLFEGTDYRVIGSSRPAESTGQGEWSGRVQRARAARREAPKGPGFLHWLVELIPDTVVAAKEIVGETVKSPFSFAEGFVREFRTEGAGALVSGWRSGLAWMGEDIGNGITAARFRFTRTSRSSLGTWLDIPRAIPFLGLYVPVSTKQVAEDDFDHSHRLYLTRGLGGAGDEDDPDVVNWTSVFREAFRKEKLRIEVKALPYRYGGVFDAIAAQLNLAQGAAYDMADRIMSDLDENPPSCGEGPAGRLGADPRKVLHLWMAGHSAGVQRVLVASRILKTQCDLATERRLGIAGPSHGLYSYPLGRRSDQINYMNGDIFQSDPVTWLDLALLAADPLSWVLRENRAYLTKADESLLHRTPGSIDPKTRIPASGYLKEEAANFFVTHPSPPTP